MARKALTIEDPPTQVPLVDRNGNVVWTFPEPLGGSGEGAQIVWRPGVPSSGIYVETWAEVVPFLAPGLILAVDVAAAEAVIPAGTYDVTGVTWQGLTTDAPAVGFVPFVQVADGAVLHNLWQVNALVFLCASVTVTPLVYSADASGDAATLFGAFAGVFLNAGALVPACVVQPGLQLEWRGFSSVFINSSAPTVPLVSISGEAIFALFGFAGTILANNTTTFQGAGELDITCDNTLPIFGTYAVGTQHVTRHSAGCGFVWTPGQPVPPLQRTPQQVETWDQCMVLITAFAGAPYTMRVDSSVAPAVIPPGSYDIGHGTWTGAGSGANATVTVQDGAQLINLEYWRVQGNLIVSSEAVATQVVTVTGFAVVDIDGATLDSSSGIGNFFTVVGFPNTLLIRVSSTGQFGPAGNPMCEVDAGAVVLDMSGHSTLGTNALLGTGGGNFFFTSDCIVEQLAVSAPGWAFNMSSSAQQTSYAATTPANWVPPSPTTVEDAINRIATQLAAVGGGPIP